MTRISTTMANHNSINQLLRNQHDLFVAQDQVASGKKAHDLKGLAKQAGTINAARAVLARSEAASDRISELTPKLDVQASSLKTIAGAAGNLRQSMISNLGLDDGLVMMAELTASFEQVSIALNQQFAGKYIFGGSRSDAPPFLADTLDDVASATSIADLFQNSDVKPVSRIDDGNALETGFLADEIATDLMGVIKAIKDFNDGINGPFGADLTSTQETFLKTQIAALDPALDALHEIESQNGLLQNRVETTQQIEADRQILLTGMIGELEDADLAEAANRLQQAQTAVEASARTFSVLSSVSLLQFLR